MIDTYAEVDLAHRPTTGSFDRDLKRVVDCMKTAMSVGRDREQFDTTAFEEARRLLRQYEADGVPPETAVAAAWFTILFLNGQTGNTLQ